MEKEATLLKIHFQDINLKIFNALIKKSSSMKHLDHLIFLFDNRKDEQQSCVMIDIIPKSRQCVCIYDVTEQNCDCLNYKNDIMEFNYLYQMTIPVNIITKYNTELASLKTSFYHNKLLGLKISKNELNQLILFTKNCINNTNWFGMEVLFDAFETRLYFKSYDYDINSIINCSNFPCKEFFSTGTKNNSGIGNNLDKEILLQTVFPDADKLNELASKAKFLKFIMFSDHINEILKILEYGGEMTGFSIDFNENKECDGDFYSGELILTFETSDCPETSNLISKSMHLDYQSDMEFQQRVYKLCHRNRKLLIDYLKTFNEKENIKDTEFYIEVVEVHWQLFVLDDKDIDFDFMMINFVDLMFSNNDEKYVAEMMNQACHLFLPKFLEEEGI